VSEEPPKPKTHRVELASTVQATVTLHAVPIIVSRPEQLAPALVQREKSVVIENDEMKRKFAKFASWQEAARWWLIPLLICWILNQAIVHDYKIDASWHLNWKVERTFDGKITLTPTDRLPRQQQTQPPSAFPD
jgi:hypothetical protein